MPVTVTLIVDVHNCNGSLYMDIFDGETLIHSSRDLDQGLTNIEFSVNWPTTVTIVTSNRNVDDVKNDSNGSIIENKAIEVTGILINNFSMHIDLIDKLFQCYDGNTPSSTNKNFWDFNGKIQMNLTHNSPMRYMLALHNQFDGNRLIWGNQ